FLHLARQSVEHLRRPAGSDWPGLVITNPPYGERLGQGAALVGVYRAFGEALRGEFKDWRAAVIVSDDELGHALGLRADKRYVLYNGAIECRLLVFDLAAEAPRANVERPLSEGAQAVANRIGKNLRHMRKRLAREGVSCYRVYDADIPEYAAAIDVHTAIGIDADTGGHAQGDAAFPQAWLHVQEYAPPREIP